MRKLPLSTLCLALLLCVNGAAGAGPVAGDAAPDFTLLGSDGNTYTLDQFKGERGLVLAWFPKAFTLG
jgi:peroxiredoxin Q/BCP